MKDLQFQVLSSFMPGGSGRSLGLVQGEPVVVESMMYKQASELRLV